MATDNTNPATTPGATSDTAPDQPRRRWNTLAGLIGTGVGLLPHILHHIGLLVGTALIAGLGGTVLFAVLGLALTVPLLIRLYRRFATWWAPAIAVLIFAAMFSLSTFVIGPMLRASMTGSTGTPSAPTMNHTGHHQQ